MKKLDFTAFPDDFVELVRLIENMRFVKSRHSDQLADREEIAAMFMEGFNVDLGGFSDYKTLELCSNGSDFGEKLLAIMKKHREEGFPDVE